MDPQRKAPTPLCRLRAFFEYRPLDWVCGRVPESAKTIGARGTCPIRLLAIRWLASRSVAVSLP
jgi:hypothetical protein